MSSIRTKVFFPAQQNGTSSPYHRVHHSNEIRRWKVASFEELQERIQNVLSTLSTEAHTTYRFEYLDDVNDWVVLEHPDEWDEAVASSSHNVLVIRVIPRVVTKRPHCQQRPPTRRGAHCTSNHCPRKAAQQPATGQALLSSGLAGALQALPFIIQLAAPASPKAPAPQQGKRSVPIHSQCTAPEHIEIRRTKSVKVPVESTQEGPVEIPVTKCAAPRVVRRIPVEDAAEEVPVRKNTSVEVEAPQQAEPVEIPVTVAPASPVRTIPIEDAQQDDDVPIVEKEESKPLEVEMSGIIENDYTIEDDEDAHEIIVDEDKEDEPVVQQQEAPQQAHTEERPQFQNEEDILQSMGFQDSKLNLHLLRHHNGNMERTINSLLQLEQ